MSESKRERERPLSLSLFLSQGGGGKAFRPFFICFILDCHSGALGVMAKDCRSGDGESVQQAFAISVLK